MDIRLVYECFRDAVGLSLPQLIGRGYLFLVLFFGLLFCVAYFEPD